MERTLAGRQPAEEKVPEAVAMAGEDERRAQLPLPAPAAGPRSADTTAHQADRQTDRQAAEEQKRIKTDGQITQTRQLQEEGAETGTL